MDHWLILLMPGLFLLLWQIAAMRVGNQAVLPTLSSVIHNFSHAMEDFIGLGSIPRNIGYSLVRVFAGYFLGASVALPLGLAMGYFPLVRTLFENFINLFKPIPPIAWMPLVLGWFGVSSLASLFGMPYGSSYVVFDNYKLSMIFLIALGSFFPILGNVLFGVSNIPITLIESARVLGANRRDIFRRILIPGSGPAIVNGLRMGMATAWVCLVSAEMLPGSMAGIGYLITHAYELSRVDLIITGMVCIGLVGWLFDGFFRLLLKRKFQWSNRMQ